MHHPNLLKNRNYTQQITIDWMEEESTLSSSKRTTKVIVKQHKPKPAFTLNIIDILLQTNKSKERQYRNDCYEELQLYLSH